MILSTIVTATQEAITAMLPGLQMTMWRPRKGKWLVQGLTAQVQASWRSDSSVSDCKGHILPPHQRSA